MTFQLILQALWFAAPVIAAGLVHIVIMKQGFFPALARVPLDGGRTFRGRRIFGTNKTLRGAVVTPLATIPFALLQSYLSLHHEWARQLAFVDPQLISPVAWGALLGTGYVLGELPNSFLKRQLEIAPGEGAPGWRGPLFWMLDQLDSLIGILLLLSLALGPVPVRAWLALIAMTLVVHPLTSLLMYAFKLKTRVG